MKDFGEICVIIMDVLRLITREKTMIIGKRYEVQKQIGVGGMGTVYKGLDKQTGGVVAIKQLKPEIMHADPQQLNRFIREGELLRQLNHPNIVKMLDAIDHDDNHYLIMEYVAGGSLHDVLQKQSQLSPQRVLYTALDVADALTRAHRLNILHRDIKPANVLLDYDGTPRLTDFGMARVENANANITEEGTLVGTLAYLSPEALTGGDVDERSDIWAFGVMLYEMLMGERPFMQTNPGQLIHAILTSPIPDLEHLRPDIPVALVDLINRMLKRDTMARIPSVRQIGAELESIIRGGTTTTMQYIPSADDSDRFGTDNFTPIAPATSRITPPHNLPNQPTAFVGREDETQTVEKLINSDANRLITLVGVGGIGKTRLALTVAERFVRPSHSTSMHNLLFSHGVFFVPLAPVENGEALIKTVADHLKMTFAGADPARTQLLNYLAEKRILLVLDNFEHLTTHTNLLSDILKSAPNVKLLVTSRELLRLRGEQLYEVPPLSMASQSNSLEDMAGACASQLFIQSAKRVAPDFEFNEITAPHVVRICALVGGLPLGIELSASWLEMLSIEEIGDEIEKSLDFLETDLRDVPERQRSLRAVFEYSWNLLTGDEREVFTKLAIFRGGFEREAAQKVAGASLRALTSLVNKSLIQRFPNGRYGLNKVLSQYAEEILKQRDDIDTVSDNHGMYFSDLLKKSTPLFNTRKEKMAIEMIDTEWENIHTALQHAMEAGEWEAIGEVSYPLLMYYVNRSLFKEGRDNFNKLADMLKAKHGEDELYWRVRTYQAWLMSRLADYADSWAYIAPAEAYFRTHNTLTDMGEALNLMSYVKMMQGDYAASVAYAEEAMTYAQHAPQEHLTWYMSQGNLGYAEFLRGNQQKALAIYEEIVQRMVENNDYSPNGIGYMLNNKGEILRSLGKFDESLALFQEAFDIFEAHNIKRGMAFTLNNIGGIEVANENIAKAQTYYERGYLLNKEIGDQNGIAHSLSAMGNNQMYIGNVKEAKTYYEKSLAIRKKIGELRGIADSLIDLGGVYSLTEDYPTALKHFYEAQAIYRQIQEPDGLGTSLVSIISTLFVINQLDDARQAVDELADLASTTGTLFVKIVLSILKIELAILENRLDDAEANLMKDAQKPRGMTNTFKLIFAVQYAEIFALRGNLAQAHEIIVVIRTLSDTTLGFLRMFAPFVLKQMDIVEKLVQRNLASETLSVIEKQAKSQTIDTLLEKLFGAMVN